MNITAESFKELKAIWDTVNRTNVRLWVDKQLEKGETLVGIDYLEEFTDEGHRFKDINIRTKVFNTANLYYNATFDMRDEFKILLSITPMM